MASRGVNKVILIGNLGADPEVRYTQAGNAVANISLATSETWKDKHSGEPREKTEWHRCVAFNRTAEIAGEYLTKGSKIYVEGKLVTRKWQDSNNQDQYTTEVRIEQMQMLDSRGDSAGQQGLARQTPGYGQQNATQGQSAPQTPPFNPNSTGDFDEIPF